MIKPCGDRRLSRIAKGPVLHCEAKQSQSEYAELHSPRMKTKVWELSTTSQKMAALPNNAISQVAAVPVCLSAARGGSYKSLTMKVWAGIIGFAGLVQTRDCEGIVKHQPGRVSALPESC